MVSSQLLRSAKSVNAQHVPSAQIVVITTATVVIAMTAMTAMIVTIVVDAVITASHIASAEQSLLMESS
jgi:hypothetical protein